MCYNFFDYVFDYVLRIGDFQVIIDRNLNIRNMSSVPMLKLIIFYKKGLVIIYKMCLKRLIWPLVIVKETLYVLVHGNE